MACGGSLLHDALAAPPPMAGPLLFWLRRAAVQTPADLDTDDAALSVIGGDALVGNVDLGQAT